MLRLTRITETHRARAIKLEGKLSGPWVDEVRQAFVAGQSSPGRTRLDLSAVDFVDAAGTELLHDLIAEGIEVVAISNFVAELLRSTGVARHSNRR